MASKLYNAGMKAIQDRTSDFAADTIKVMLLASDVAYTFNQDETSMTTPTASELSVSGYAGGFAGADRRTLGTKTITNDTTNDRSVFDAADPAAWSPATGKTITGAIVYKHLTSDAASTPIAFIDLVDTGTNGSPLSLIFDATGIFYIQN